MRYRKLSIDGDYSFGNGQADFYKDVPEAPAQAVKTRLMLWLGEWFLDTSEGTPYLQGVLGKHPEETRNAVLRERIVKTEGIIGLENFSTTVDPDKRSLAMSATVNTLYGSTTIQTAV